MPRPTFHRSLPSSRSIRTRAATGWRLLLCAGWVGSSGCKPGATRPPAGAEAPGQAADAARARQAEKVEAARREATAITLLEQANEDLGRGRYVSAARRAEESLAAHPDDPDAWAVLGAARWRAGDYAASTAAYESALKADPTNFGAVLGLARNLQAKGSHVRAVELLDRLTEEDDAQVDPWLGKLWSQYAALDVEGATTSLDEIFALLPADDPQLPLVQAYAAFIRPLGDIGSLCAVEGERGSMDAGLDHDFAIKYTSAIASEEFTRVVFLEGREEALVDPALVRSLGLSPIGEVTPLGAEEPAPLVVLPSLRFGELELRNVPAIVQPLASYEPAMGEVPGVLLGRQALAAFGSYTFDFAAGKMTVTRDRPEPAEGSIEVPLLLVSMHIVHAPAIPVRIDGSDHEFFVYFGGFERSSMTVTAKDYLKSGHLPRELEEPDDEARGLKMVFLRDVTLGDRALGGAGGLVLVNTPPDPTLDLFLQNTAFELGGYLNTRMMERWAVTYLLDDGAVRVVMP